MVSVDEFRTSKLHNACGSCLKHHYLHVHEKKRTVSGYSFMDILCNIPITISLSCTLLNAIGVIITIGSLGPKNKYKQAAERSTADISVHADLSLCRKAEKYIKTCSIRYIRYAVASVVRAMLAMQNVMLMCLMSTYTSLCQTTG